MLSGNSNDDVSEDDNYQLLRDIKEISNALYWENPSLSGGPSSSLSRAQSRSVEKPRFPVKDKRLGSLWDWKKPLRALSHIGQHRFDCCFYLNVHSVEGMGCRFDGLSLCVNWKRKDEVLRTRDVRVAEGKAEFGESLMLRCCVYGSENDMGVTKYKEKISMLYVSVVGVPGLDIGKHWVDLTRLLPLSLEELVGLRSFGKWTTSMKLTGMAEGAVLNVSLSFSVLKDNSMVSGNSMSFYQLLKLTQDWHSSVETGAGLNTKTGNGSLRRAGSIPSSMNLGYFVSSQPVELKVSPELLLSPRLELSKSINYLYQKLDEQEECDLAKSEVPDGHVLPLKTEVIPDSGFVNNENDCEWEDIEFTVIEKGVELSDNEQLKTDHDGGQNRNASADETIDAEENGKKMNNTADDFIHEGEKELNNVCMKESDLENLDPHHRHHRALTTLCGEFYVPLSASEFSEQEGYLDAKTNYRSNRLVQKSLSLDDVYKSENNFSFLGIENGLSSPREKLLREFEEEVLASGNFIFDFDADKEQEESGSTVLTSSDSIANSDPFEFLSAFPHAERHEKTMQSLRERRKVTFLEDLETEDLMRKWGLNEKVFRSSPRYHSSGFGSPIELPPESPLELPPLGEGLCPYVGTEYGGQLRSMNPRLFRNAKNGARLVMQVSRPVVLPAELGSEISEVLHCLASVGEEKLSLQMEKMMPLDDITGKRFQQVQDTETRSFMHKQRVLMQHESDVEQHRCRQKEVIEDFLFSHQKGSSGAGLTGIDMDLEYVSLEDVSPLAIEKIEPLSIEGLRIQSGMPNEDAPSRINPQPFQKESTFQGYSLFTVGENNRDVIELLDLSLTLDEWLRIDGGQREGKKWGNGFDRKHRLLPNYLMIALRLQLRDPFRNFEPVGSPMLAFIHVGRVSISIMPEIYSMAAKVNHKEENSEVVVKEEMREEKSKMEYGDSISKFKIIELHLAGLQSDSGNQQHWGTATHRRSGVRWLLASGMGKIINFPFSKSKAILRASRPIALKLKPEVALWSISSCNKGSSQFSSHRRNPDIIFQNGSTRLSMAKKMK